MLENGAAEAIVEVRSGFGGEDVALLRVETHPPLGCQFLEALEVGLHGEVILKGAGLPIEQAVIREESYCGRSLIIIIIIPDLHIALLR